jgi:hypothetical protein
VLFAQEEHAGCVTRDDGLRAGGMAHDMGSFR